LTARKVRAVLIDALKIIITHVEGIGGVAKKEKEVWKIRI
jgi:hypothetical protein